MKLTREMLDIKTHYYPPYMSAEQIFIEFVDEVIHKCPQVLPDLSIRLGYAYSGVLEAQREVLHLANERAWYLETYLSGNMYPEDKVQNPEYIDIQRGHATTIKERTAKVLGEE